MEKIKFHIEDWMNYYNAKFDEEHFIDEIIESCEGESAKVRISEDLITTDVESSFSYCIGMIFEDVETGEEVEIEADVWSEYSYTARYKLIGIDNYIDDIEEAIAEAIEAGQSTFEFEMYANLLDVSNVDASNASTNDISDEDLERFGGEKALLREVIANVKRDLSEETDARFACDFIQPPSDKLVRFICTIPAE